MCYWDYCRGMMRKEECERRKNWNSNFLEINDSDTYHRDTNRYRWTRGDAVCRRWRCARDRTAGRSSWTRCPCRMPARRVSQPWGPRRRDTWWSLPWGTRATTLTSFNVNRRRPDSATSAAVICMVWSLDLILAFLPPPFPSLLRYYYFIARFNSDVIISWWRYDEWRETLWCNSRFVIVIAQVYSSSEMIHLPLAKCVTCELVRLRSQTIN